MEHKKNLTFVSILAKFQLPLAFLWKRTMRTPLMRAFEIHGAKSCNLIRIITFELFSFSSACIVRCSFEN